MKNYYYFLKADEFFAQYWHKNSTNSKPAPISPQKHPYRSLFERDRDRVMYSSAFRLLESKTQVFSSQTTVGLRTRLTHSLEVSQIARTISKQLGLDEELTEAIALGHDVGHTPFGHIGERTLNTFSIGKDKKQEAEGVVISPNNYGFKHNLQSVRVLVEYSEDVLFSNYLLFGVREHSNLFWRDKEDVSFYDIYDIYCSYCDGEKRNPAWSFEAFVVKWADEIAQRHHDIEDAFLKKIMHPEDIVDKVRPLVKIIDDDSLTEKFKHLENESEKLTKKDYTTKPLAFNHALSSFLVDTYVTILIEEFRKVLNVFCNEQKINNKKEFKEKYPNIDVELIRNIMRLENSKIQEVDKILGKSLKYSILDSSEVQRTDGKGSYIIRKLVRAYTSNPQQLPNEFINRFIKVELKRNILKKDYTDVLDQVKGRISDLQNNTDFWKDYECREALREISKDPGLRAKTYDSLLRVILDYIASMTDSYATSQYTELY